MRGTHLGREDETVRPGIIPAYAGNTRDARGRIRPDGDHPRVCGEHLGLAIPPELERGSSPRMRGTRLTLTLALLRDGIIHAYAGNTTGQRPGCADVRDHPRVCGEHVAGELFAEVAQGSSPRMRGTLRSFPQSPLALGIIPAYAGNTR